MGKIIVRGGRKLKGRLCVQGSKNAILPMLAACVLCDGQCTIYNCPDISDVEDALEIIRELGGKAHRVGRLLNVDTRDIRNFEICKPLMHKMRSSVMFLGAILARMGKAVVYTPGGCEIGNRPIDIHIDALSALGASVFEEEGRLDCTFGGKKAQDVYLKFPSVGATENAVMASVLGKGTVTVHNTAKEPEILELQKFINAMGGRVSGAGTDTIVIEGVRSLHGTTYTVAGDRIVCATYLMAAAATGGDICLTGICPSDVRTEIGLLRQMGCAICHVGQEICLKAQDRPLALKKVETQVFPGFPTDAQAPLTACMAVAQGTTEVVEHIFENRFRHIPELIKMGADISVVGKKAIIKGVPKLYGAQVEAKELRGAGALVLAGLCAEGVTKMTGTEFLDRGYEHIERALTSLNADIVREGEYGC